MFAVVLDAHLDLLLPKLCAAICEAILALSHLEELRLHCSDLSNYDRSPFLPAVRGISRLSTLKKLTLFTRLDATGTEALAGYISDPTASRRLVSVVECAVVHARGVPLPMMVQLESMTADGEFVELSFAFKRSVYCYFTLSQPL